MDERKIASLVDRWAREHRMELVEDLKKLLSIPSVAEYDQNGYPMGPSCAQAADFLMETARHYGIETENDDYFCAVLNLPSKETTAQLGILGHLDVVPPGYGWKQDAFQPFEQKGFIFGRGAIDNKGPIMMAVYVMRCIKELDIPFRSGITIIAGCDEEKEMRDAAHYLSGHAAPDFTLICDGAWPVGIGEKGMLEAELLQEVKEGNLIRLSGGRVSNQVPDYAEAVLADVDPDVLIAVQNQYQSLHAEEQNNWIVLSCCGKAAHCSTPDHGDNAILQLISILLNSGLVRGDASVQLALLEKCFIDYNGTGLRIYHADALSGTTTCVPVSIELKNGILRTGINVRYCVSQNGDILVKKLRKRCNQLGMELKVLSHEKPRLADADDPVVKLLLQNCQKNLSRKCKPYVTGGGTYARCFPNSIPYGPVYLEPGLPKRYGQPHEANEAACIEQLLEGIKIYVLALMKLDEYFSD